MLKTQEKCLIYPRVQERDLREMVDILTQGKKKFEVFRMEKISGDQVGRRKKKA